MQSFFLGDPRGPYGYIEVIIHPGLCHNCGVGLMCRNSTVLREGDPPGAARNTGQPSSRDIPPSPCVHPRTNDGYVGSARRARVRGQSPPPRYSLSAEQDDGSPEDDQWLSNFPYSRLMDGPDCARTRGFPRFAGPIPGPSWFRPRGFSIEAYRSNIAQRAQTSLRRNEAIRGENREQLISPDIDPQLLHNEREPSFSPIELDDDSDDQQE